MITRWHFALIASAIFLATRLSVSAQPPFQAPYVQYIPVQPTGLGVIPYGGADPYATSGVQPAGWLPVGGIGLPTMSTLEDRLWFCAEYLHWWTEGINLPPLVTTSPAGTPQNQAAVLGEPGTTILFGNGQINGDSTGGWRTGGGFWLTRDGAYAIEGEYFRLADQNEGFGPTPSGDQIFGRPIFDVVNGRETAQLFNYPGLVNGSTTIDSETSLQSFLINARAALMPTRALACDACERPDRIDWIVGYRRVELNDRLGFNEPALESQVVNTPGTIAVNEGFATSNEFNGLQLGIVYQANFRRAWLESMLRVAAGNNTQTADIRGQTRITELGVTDTFTGGILAQRTNIGKHQRDEFTMIPEVGMTLGIRVTNRLHATVGYTVFYFPNVARAGDQIDLDVNPNLIPEEVAPFSGPLRPRFRFIESDYLAHGINVGAELRF